ncbi:SGNH/GDSL hydrolase family protein [Aeromonas hydrophila]
MVYCNHAQNDCNSFGSDTAEFTENLKLFVNTCRKYGKVPVLVTPNTTFVSGGITEKANVRLPSFVDAIRSVAKTMKVDLVDNYYFFKKTLRSVKASDLTPDGVHPSKKGYAMVGRNLAMPLLSYGSLRDDFDGFGISNVNYSDTFSNERFLQVSDSRYGNTIICRSDDSVQKINIPVVLDNPTDRTVIGINCLSWIDGGFVMATHDNSIQSEEFSGMMDQSNGIAVDYRSVISPDVCNLYAGLHLVGIYTGMGLVSDTGKMSFSGVTLLPRNVSCVGESFPQARRSRDFKRSIMAGDTIEFRCNVLADDMCFLEIAPVVGSTSPWLSIKKISGNVIVDLWGGQTTVLNEISIGMHNFTVKVNHDRSISIKIDNLVDVTTSKALTGHPLSFILGENLSNEIYYFVSR